MMENVPQAQHPRSTHHHVRGITRRATHHGASQSSPPRAPPPPRNVVVEAGAAPPQQPVVQQLQQQQAGMHSDPHMFDPERMQQMFAEMQAYSAFPGPRPAHSQHAQQQQQQQHPQPPPPQYGQLPDGQPTLNGWGRGREVAHLQPPAFAQEHFAMAPFASQAPVTEFGGAFAPAMGGGGPNGMSQGQNGMPTLGPHVPAPAPAALNGGHGYAIRPKEAGTAGGSSSLAHHPQDLDAWRQRLFDVDEMIILTQEQYETYWPHIDNVYSHRSTQRYKSRPFLSHYYDCRLKGRPAGTPKSLDPNKKKRKRVARERDLCDVKVKVTEYLAGATREDVLGHLGMQPGRERAAAGRIGRLLQEQGSWTQLPLGEERLELGPEGGLLKSFYVVQRINGGGAGEDNGAAGAGDAGGRHRHTLEESDRVKKNSVVRQILKHEKEARKSGGNSPEKKTYHKRATGAALETAKKHAADHELKLYGSCFCPFVQRVWISLEAKHLSYQYIEVDPYAKPKSLLEINPRGLVPALRHGDWGCYESTVLMEYLEDLDHATALLPPDPQEKAYCRLWSDHINRHVIPMFYRCLQAQQQDKQIQFAQELTENIAKLVAAADPHGPFFLGGTLGFVDVQIAPWILRLRRVLTPFRGWPAPERGSRWEKWVAAIEADPMVKKTTSGDELYLDSYERYAENRPNTSQLANAVNAGRGLP